MGEFIDCETYIRNKDILNLVQLLYRDPISNDIPNLIDLDYNSTVGAYNYYMSWRNDLFEHYFDLFEDQTDYEKKKKLAAKMGIKIDDDIEKERNADNEWNRQWGWYSTLFETLCDGDLFKMKQAYNLLVIETFNHLTYLLNKKKK